MMFCPNCGEKVPVDAKFCGICGAELRQKSRQMLDFFELKKLKDLFGYLLLYKDIKKILEVGNRNPADVMQDILLEMRHKKTIIDRKHEMIIFLESYLIQVLAESYPDKWGNLDISRLEIEYETEYPNLRKRAQQLARAKLDPGRAWQSYFLEQMVLANRISGNE